MTSLRISLAAFPYASTIDLPANSLKRRREAPRAFVSRTLNRPIRLKCRAYQSTTSDTSPAPHLVQVCGQRYTVSKACPIKLTRTITELRSDDWDIALFPPLHRISPRSWLPSKPPGDPRPRSHKIHGNWTMATPEIAMTNGGFSRRIACKVCLCHLSRQNSPNV